MNSLVIGAYLNHGPGEVVGYVAFRAALQPSVQTLDWIYLGIHRSPRLCGYAVRLNSVQLRNVPLNSTRLNSVRLKSVRLISVRDSITLWYKNLYAAAGKPPRGDGWLFGFQQWPRDRFLHTQVAHGRKYIYASCGRA